jgi:DNA-binding LacI/PurR family transcriptional regulator
VQSLREAGCVSFAHVRFAEDGSVIPSVRRAAVRAALGDAPDHEIHFERSSTDDPALDGFLQAHLPDGVVCDSDELANLVWRSAERIGLQPGRSPGRGRIVVTGVDDAAVRRRRPVEQRWPSMTLDYPAFMQAVVDVLIARRNGDRAPQQRYVPPVLIGALGHDPEDRSSPSAAFGGDAEPPV